jgi:putative peptidoglycan lipid II flippase
MSAAPPEPPAPPEDGGPGPTEGPGTGEAPVLPAGLGRSAAVMAVGTALSRLTGLGRLAALVYALGVTESRLADSYNIANTMPNILYELVLGGVLSSVFIPVVVEQLRTKAPKEADEAVSAMATTALVLLVALSALTVVAAPWVIKLFTIRLSGPEAAQQQELATYFLRFFAPQIAFYGYAAIAGGLLNAHNRFAVPMFAPILNNVVVIGTFLAFAAIFGSSASDAAVAGDTGAKLLLALGTTGGVAAMALAHWPYVRRLPSRIRFRPEFRHPAVRKLAGLSGWTLGYVVANQIGLGIGLVLANGVQGGPTAFFTAFAFFQLPYGIAAVSVMTALSPRLSAQAVDGDDAGFAASISGGIRALGLVMLPATAAYLALARPLISTLLEHGVVSAGSSELLARMLQLFAIGLLPFSLFLLFLRAFYARQDARTPMLVNLALNAVFIAATVALFPSIDVRGLALAHSLCYVAGAVIAGRLLSRRVGGLRLGPAARVLARVAVASVLAWAAMAFTADRLSPDVVQLVAGGLVGAGVFVAACRVLRIDDLTDMRRILLRR